MRKVVLDLAASLDGYIEGPNGEIDWCIMDDEMDFPGFLAGIDTIFYGRVSYDMWGSFQPDASSNEAERSLWSAVHSKKKYVFSRTAREDKQATFINSGISENVKTIKEQPGDNIWLYGGGKLITTFINENLVDVYRLSIHPVILAGGKLLFENIRTRKNLRLTHVSRYASGVVQLVYERQ